MAFVAKNLSALSYANGFTLWHYKTNDLATEVDASGYFNAAAGMMRVGDFIMANCDLDGAPVNAILAVNENAAGTVDTLNFLHVGTSDNR